MTEIKFGTSGWRGILAEDFTFPNARLVCQAIADYLQQEGLTHQGVVIGYDTRFRSEAFAATAAEVMAGNGITSHLTTRDCPTPVVSFATREGKRAGALNITASHNPAEYNGLKFSPASGGPAPEAVTKPIEALIGTMTLAVMTRASLGHTGRPLVAGHDTTTIYVLVTLAAVLRLLAPLGGAAYIFILSLAGAAWSGAFGLLEELSDH